MTGDLKKIEKAYKKGATYKEIESDFKITQKELKNLIKKNEWKRASNRSKAQKKNKNAKGNKGGHAPKGNKNALVTGAYESIYSDFYTDEEKAFIEKIKTEDKRKVIEQQYELLLIRERRMLERIQELKKPNKDLTISSVQRSKSCSTEFGGTAIEGTITMAESTVEKIQRIEEALTKIQEAKRRCVDLLHRMDIDNKKYELQEKIFEAKNSENNQNKESKLEELFNLIKDGVADEY